MTVTPVVMWCGGKGSVAIELPQVQRTYPVGTWNFDAIAVVTHNLAVLDPRFAQYGLQIIECAGNTPCEYATVLQHFSQNTIHVLSGWMKKVRFIPKWMFNCHPGQLPLLGGPGMYGM